MYYVYVLLSHKDKQYYTGFTHDLMRRIAEHNEGLSKATKGRIPLELVYYEFCLNQKDAVKREKYLKTTWGKRYIKNRIKHYTEAISELT